MAICALKVMSPGLNGTPSWRCREGPSFFLSCACAPAGRPHRRLARWSTGPGVYRSEFASLPGPSESISNPPGRASSSPHGRAPGFQTGPAAFKSGFASPPDPNVGILNQARHDFESGRAPIGAVNNPRFGVSERVEGWGLDPSGEI